MKEYGNLEQLVTTGVDDNGSKPSSADIFKKVNKTLNDPGSGLSTDDKLRLALLTYSNICLSSSSLVTLKETLAGSSDSSCLSSLGYLGLDTKEPSKSTKSRLTDS